MFLESTKERTMPVTTPQPQNVAPAAQPKIRRLVVFTPRSA
jgi:hypothetical protein